MHKPLLQRADITALLAKLQGVIRGPPEPLITKELLQNLAKVLRDFAKVL